jgi:lipopolysaccharide transport system permease protein/teichoic acid transport system permease protein
LRANRLQLLLYLAGAELARRHAGTAGGMLWAIAAPLGLIAAMWVALDLGLGLRVLLGPDYSLMLVLGMLPWLMFADTVGDATSAIVRAPHLVKKTVFPVELLPLTSVVAAMAVHGVLVLLAMAALALLGRLTPSGLPVLLLSLALCAALAAGIALALAGLNVLVRDVGATVPFALTVGFWLTPVIWPLAKVPAEFRWLVALNPMAIVVEGYRSALLGTSFPFTALQVAGAVALTAIVLAFGAWLFRVLRHSFADAL